MLQLGFVAAINLFCSSLCAVFSFQARFCVRRSIHPDYPEFDDTLEGPSLPMSPSNHQALNYVRLLWPTALCELIAVETNRYAFQRHVRRGCPGREIVAFAVSVVGGCFSLRLNSTFTDAVKNFIQVLYMDQTLHLKCLEV